MSVFRYLKNMVSHGAATGTAQKITSILRKKSKVRSNRENADEDKR